MIVQYDHQIFIEQKFGGISRYFIELIKGFQKDQEIQPQVDVVLSNNEALSEVLYSNNRTPSFKGKKDLARIINSFLLNRKLATNSFDIYHPTYYNSSFLKYNKKPLVVTIHDLIDEKFNQHQKDTQKLINQKRELILKADTLITVSESTKKDLISLYSVIDSKIKVIYLGSSIKAPENSLFKKKKD